jgi:hypothetical protein
VYQAHPVAEPTDPAAELEPPVRASPWKVLAGAWLAAPTLVAVLGALVAAGQDCDDGSVWTLVLLAGAAAGLAGWWGWRCRAPAWLIALSVLGGGLAGGAAGTFAWFIVSFERCFTF